AFAIAGFSALMGFTNLFPIGMPPARAHRTDGGRFRRLGTGSGAQEALTELRLLALVFGQDRPVNWQNADVERLRLTLLSATELATSGAELRRRLLAMSLYYYSAVEHGKLDVASKLVTDLLGAARTREVNDAGYYFAVDLLAAFHCAFREA